MDNQTTQEKPIEPVAVLTLRSVKPGCEERFETELHDFIARSLHTEGQLGVHVLRLEPGSGSREYGIVRCFSSAQKKWVERTIFPIQLCRPVMI